MTARSQRGLALALGGALALLFTVVGAFQIAGWTVGAVARTSHQVLHGPVERVTVDAGSGEVVVVAGASDEVRVDSTVTGSLHTPRLRAVKDGAQVRMRAACPSVSFGPCRASIVVHVPAATAVDVRAGDGELTAEDLTGAVRLHAGAGDVNATGLRGEADLSTGSGNVNVRDLRGRTSLRTDSGDISGDQLAAARVEAVTASGDIDLDFVGAPRDVDVASASGDVQVALPRGASYRVVADTGSGDSRTDVRTDPDSPRVVRARTSSGNVGIDYRN